MTQKIHFSLLCLGAAVILLAGALQAQTDPGVRGGAPGVGGPLVGLNSDETAFFNGALDRFQDLDSVKGTIAGAEDAGLGPRFNADGCATCHAAPATGGSSPTGGINPQVALATAAGAKNTVPSFVFNGGPVREARFIFQ